MHDRCGAKGMVKEDEGKGRIVVEVLSLITHIPLGQRTVELPADLSVGMLIPMETIFREHRGLAIVDEHDECLDEGEVWPIGWPVPSSLLEFVSDHDDGPWHATPVERLVGQRVEIKYELFDRLGAYRRLREFKKAFRSK